jgi:hypothetical protein
MAARSNWPDYPIQCLTVAPVPFVDFAFPPFDRYEPTMLWPPPPPGRRSEGFIEPCLPTVADMTPGGPAMTGAGFAKGAQRVIYFLENDPPRECRNIVQSRAE